MQHSEAPNGALIIDNGGTSKLVNTGSQYSGVTLLPSFSGTIASTPSSSAGTTSYSVTFASRNYTDTNQVANVLAGVRVRSNTAFTGSPSTPNDWTDDEVVTVVSSGTTSAGAGIITLNAASLANASAGNTVRSIDILDYIDVANGGVLRSHGDLYVTNGNLANPAPGARLEFTNGLLDLRTTGADVRPAQPSYTLTAGTYWPTTLSAFNYSQSGATVALTTLVTGGDLNLASGTLTAASITTTGSANISGGTLNHIASTATAINRLQMSVGGSFNLTGGTIDLWKLGLPGGYTFGGGTVPTTTGTATQYSGGSHGGRGGYVSTGNASGAGHTYGDLRSPTMPGAGGSAASYPGGGSFVLTSAGDCQINGSGRINANGNTNAAGGSIFLTCGSFSGTPSNNAITANGGDFGGSQYAAGGGGRIALVTTGNQTAWSGDFAFPDSLSKLNNFKLKVRSWGGAGNGSTSFPSGGAGTVYLKHSGLTHGALIVDNGGRTTVETNAGRTLLVSAEGTLTSNGTTNSLPVNLTSEPALTATRLNVFSGMKVRVADGGTPNNWSDDTFATITGNNGTSLTTAENMSAVASGQAIKSVEILDHIDIDGNAIVETNGDLWITNGQLRSVGNPLLSLENSLLLFRGTGRLYTDTLNYTFSAGTLNATTVSANLATFTGGALVATTTNLTTGLVMNSGGLTSTNINAGTVTQAGGTVTAETISVTSGGNYTISGGTLTHPTGVGAGQSSLKRLTLNIPGGNLTVGGTGSIDVSAKGFQLGYGYSADDTKYQNATDGHVSSTTAGGSHGGAGGATASTSIPGKTYGDFRNPLLPGSASSATGSGSAGGAIVASVSGTCTVNSGGSIKANGGAGAAGGSINLRCGGFAGDAGAAAITANGGNSGGTFAGGGGRIALVSSGNNSSFGSSSSLAFPLGNSNLNLFKLVVNAKGGAATSVSQTGGGAGTIYVESTGTPNGVLIVDNKDQALYQPISTAGYEGKTMLPGIAGSIQSVTSQTAFTVSTLLPLNEADALTGQRLRFKAASFGNATPDDASDDCVATVTSATTSSITLAVAPSAGCTISAGDTFRSLVLLDNIDIAGNSVVYTTADLLVLSGLAISPDQLAAGI